MVRISQIYTNSLAAAASEQNGAFYGDKAFRYAGQKPGLEIWRIEKLEVMPVDQKEYGKFYSGDAYIVMHTSASQPPEWNIHFWLGNSSSTDEQGVAAIKTVELDDSLGGSPIQHREVQGHESKKFLSYFKAGIRYLEGGIESGFKHVEKDSYETRLFQIKGKRNCRVQQVALNRDSLNQGDVFLLDAGLNLYVWTGPQSSRAERVKGADLARQIRDEERQGRAAVHIIEDKWDTDPSFYQALGDKPGYIRTAAEGGDDTAIEKRAHTDTKLFRVSDASGRMQITEIKERPLAKGMLDTNDCFMLDAGTSGIFAWVGKGCTQGERSTVWSKSTEYLKQSGYPQWTSITRVNEGTETPVFKQAMNWPTEAPTQVTSPTSRAKINQEEHKVDAKTLHKRSVAKAKDFMPDQGMGEKRVWRVENFFLVPVDKLQYGTFYSGDSYIILYQYQQNGVLKGIVYFWQGLKSSRDEQAAAAMLAVQIDEKEMHGQAVQIRAVQNKEPEHFLKMFNDRLVIFMGGHASGFKNVNDKDSYDVDGTRLFQIRDNRVVQVPEKAASLNSNDMFVLETPHKTYIWHGEGASDRERELSKEFAKWVIHLKNPTMIDEGNEPAEFWQVLGGKAPYASGKPMKEQKPTYPARLFHCTNAVGYFRVEEIVDFDQEDLNEDDVMLLDTFEEIFVWVGKNANDIEKKESMKTAMEYIKTDPLGRTTDSTTIVTVKQGFEPPAFTGHFLAWDPEKWSHGKSYEDLKRELGEENTKLKTVIEELNNYERTYPLETLLQSPLPEGVDPIKKEEHLIEEDYKRAFGMSKAEYNRIPPWKRLDLKKKAGLF